MKLLIIIAIAFVLLIPTTVFAQEESLSDIGKRLDEENLERAKQEGSIIQPIGPNTQQQSLQKIDCPKGTYPVLDNQKNPACRDSPTTGDQSNIIVDFTNLLEPIIADFTNLVKPVLQEIRVLDYISFELFVILFWIGIIGIILGVIIKQKKKSNYQLTIKKCVECGGKFSRIDVYKFPKSNFTSDWVCRSDVQRYLQKVNPVKEIGGDLWICSHCRPPQKFTDRQQYINHHISHN